MAYIIMWNIPWVFLMGVEIALCMLAAGIYFYKGKQKEVVNEKVMFYGFACLLLFGFGVSQTFWFIAVMQFPGTYENYTFYVKEYYLAHPPFMARFFSDMWGLFSWIGSTLYFYAFERVLKRTRYLLTIISIVLFISLLILREFLYFEVFSFIFASFIQPFFGLASLIILIIYTRLSRLEGKAVACFFYLWFALSGLAPIYHNLGFYYFSGKIISGILWIIAILMALIPLYINPRYLSRALRYWRISGVSITILYLFTWILVFFIYENPSNPITNASISQNIIVMGIIYMVVYFFIARSIKYEKPLEEIEGVSRGLGAFVRPQRITEQEVSISKEKKICLVCKGKLGGIMFMCRDCEAFYCGKCIQALIELENACWVCDNALDESKPIKLVKKKEEEIKIEHQKKS